MVAWTVGTILVLERVLTPSPWTVPLPYSGALPWCLPAFSHPQYSCWDCSARLRDKSEQEPALSCCLHCPRCLSGHRGTGYCICSFRCSIYHTWLLEETLANQTVPTPNLSCRRECHPAQSWGMIALFAVTKHRQKPLREQRVYFAYLTPGEQSAARSWNRNSEEKLGGSITPRPLLPFLPHGFLSLLS